jgi:site-specific DNA-methyltransferase (adenine-specific)
MPLPQSLADALGRIHHHDCIAGMNALPAGSVDLAFADPPFNIGYDYDVYHDAKDYEEYLAWSRKWIGAVHRVLKPDGTFWLAIGDEYAAELKLQSQKLGFHIRSWVIWYYTFGVNCKFKFSRSHAHLFHFVKDPKKFTYLSEQLENRVPSARLVVYGDSRGNPNGRLPDDTWILRPQDLAGHFTPEEDTWYFPRVAGTFKERAGFHGCQMPEQLLGRIIRICSHENEIVLDPFSGSATTLAVAKKLGRRSLGFDLSPDYVKRGTDRLAGIRVGDPLDGAPEPTMSALSTANGKKLADKLNGHPAAPLTKRGIFGKIPRKPPEKPMPLFEAAKNTKRSRTALKATTNNKPRSSKSQSSKSQSSKPKSSRRKAK